MLEVWESAAALSPVARAVALGTLARPDLDVDAVERLPLGVRDAALLRFRQDRFGDGITCLTNCPTCRAQLEFSLSVASLLAVDKGMVEGGWIDADGVRLSFRMPCSADLQAALASGPADDFGDRLLWRCVNGDEAMPALSAAAADRLAAAIEAADPLSVIWIDLACAACRHAWRSVLDIAVLLWQELDRWASATLNEISKLARAYGWGEAEILAMTPGRRRRYLEMVAP